MAKKKSSGSENFFHMALDGHILDGEKKNGKWTFSCEHWPELAEKHKGDSSLVEVMAEFFSLALKHQLL